MKEFKKSDLQTGMRVYTKLGKKYIVMLNSATGPIERRDILVNLEKPTYVTLSRYNENLTRPFSEEYDIIKVTKSVCPGETLCPDCEEEIIWEKEDPYKYSDIEKDYIEILVKAGFEYIARNEDGKLYAYSGGKPHKNLQSNKWLIFGFDEFLLLRDNEIFKNVKWEDDEPLNLTKINLK